MRVQRQSFDLVPGGGYYARHTTIEGVTEWHNRPDFCSITLIKRGNGRVLTPSAGGGSRLTALDEGDLVFLRPFDAILIAAGLASAVSFRATTWATFAKLADLEAWMRAPVPPKKSRAEKSKELARAFDHVVDQARKSPTIFDLIDFWAVAVPLIAGESTPRAPSDPPMWLVEALEAMRDERNLGAGFPRLLELADVSPGHLSATTRRCYGQTPVALIYRLRLQHAAHLLRSTTDPVAQVARRCGFQSAAHFSNRFRREFGVAPRDYRARLAAGRAVEWPS